VIPVLGRLHTGAHALLGAAMVAMVCPTAPGWLCLAVSTPVAVWFVGTAVLRRRPIDLHHALMAAAMVWMAAMPHGPVPCHGGTGPVTGAVAGYFWLAAAPFLTAPFRTGSRGPVLGSLSHAAMSLAMAVLLTVP
jgi:hypothetical protein